MIFLDKEPIHFFLDTTLTFQDPFFKRNFNRQLIRLSVIHEIPLYMSKVVFEETRSKYEMNVNDRIGKLESSLKDLEIFDPTTLDTVSINCTLTDFMSKFDEYYDNLFKAGVIKLVEYDNSLLPILVERSIKRIKPFGNKKQEFRDAITWLSYANLAENNKLDNCFLITNNTDDFCENKTKNTIHPDLMNDTTRFSHYNSAKELIEQESRLQPYIMSVDIMEWLTAQKIDEDYVENLFSTTFNNSLIETFFDYLGRQDVDHFLSAVYFSSYIEGAGLSILSIGELTITVVDSQAVVTGDIEVNVDIKLYYDDEEFRRHSNFRYVGEDSATLISSFTFTIDKESVHIDSLEFDNFDVLEKAAFSFLRDYDDDDFR